MWDSLNAIRDQIRLGKQIQVYTFPHLTSIKVSLAHMEALKKVQI